MFEWTKRFKCSNYAIGTPSITENELLLLRNLKALKNLSNRTSWEYDLTKIIETLETKYLQCTNVDKREILLDLHSCTYGGMGTLRDVLYGDKRAIKALDETAQAFNKCLKDNWQDLGKEINSIPSTELFTTGQRVKLIPGEVWDIDNFGKERTVPDQSHLKDPYWTITSIGTPDITNMPIYNLSKIRPKSGTDCKSVRHNAVKPV